jgi:DNA-directed RNA polymerase specialized sigma24 family protein
MPTSHPDPDADLVTRLRDGDERAFRAIWDRHHDRLIRFVYRYLQSTDAAADIVQEVFFPGIPDVATPTMRADR